MILKDFSKLICDISKINDYWIFKEDKDSAIIGTIITINQAHMENGLFQRVNLQLEAEIPIFFIITITDDKKRSDIEKSFKGYSIPVKVIKTKKEIFPLDNLKTTLSEFVNTEIKRWKQVGYNL